jgi:hypothetical protein
MVWKRRKVRISNKEFYTLIFLYKYEHLSILLSWHLITISVTHARIRLTGIFSFNSKTNKPDNTLYEMYISMEFEKKHQVVKRSYIT